LQASRGTGCTFGWVDEFPWVKHSSLITSAPIFQPKGVSVLFTSSMTNRDHWSARLMDLAWNGKPLVKSIVQPYMCESCIAKGHRGVCIHKIHLVPRHIDGTEGNPVRMLMDLLAKGSYELECLGVADFVDSAAEKLFADDTLDNLSKCPMSVSQEVISACNSGLLVAIDPTPSNVSGIGLVGGIVRAGRRIVSFTVAVYEFLSLLPQKTLL